MMSAEERVDSVMKNRELRAGFFEQGIEITATGAVHQLDGNLHFRAANRIELHQLAELFEISGLWIECFALERSDHCRFDAPVGRLQFSDPCLDLFCDFRRCRSAVAGRKLETLVLSGIMAGGHVDAANRLAMA